MKSVVSARGQTVVPKEVRDAVGIEAGAEIEWIVKDGRISVFVIPRDPVRALRGILKGHETYSDWLADRNEERARERQKDEEEFAKWQSKS